MNKKILHNFADRFYKFKFVNFFTSDLIIHQIYNKIM